MKQSKDISRRHLVGGGALIAAAGVLASRAEAQAPKYGTAPKAAVGYRDQPNAGHDCSGCRFFIPAADPAQPGHCHVVAGAISPHGWCSVWTAKT
ncbi:MAG: high-potential iron-sulfur protein [Acetobacteraceae bacterium]